jgi:hypothetical protein
LQARPAQGNQTPCQSGRRQQAIDFMKGNLQSDTGVRMPSPRRPNLRQREIALLKIQAAVNKAPNAERATPTPQ